MPRSRIPPADYVLESSTKDMNRYSTSTLRDLVRIFNETSQTLEQVCSLPDHGLHLTS